MSTTLTSVYEQRVAVKQELNSQIATVKTLIALLHPNGSYEDYNRLKHKLDEIELHWGLIRLKLPTGIFNFHGTIRRLRKDSSFIYGNFFADELDKAEPKDIHGYATRIEEIATDLRNQRNEYLKHPDIKTTLQTIADLQRKSIHLKINVNSSYGIRTA